MVRSTARVATDQPERYIKQLVSHLAHKLTTRLEDDGRGSIGFESGRCVLAAEPGSLVLVATADDDAALEHVRGVVTRHLERFGGRAGLEVNWNETV